MNWDVHLQLEILFSTTNNGQIVDKATAGIHVLETSGVKGVEAREWPQPGRSGRGFLEVGGGERWGSHSLR